MDREQLQATLALMDGRIYQWFNACHRDSRICIRCGDFMLLRDQISRATWSESLVKWSWYIVRVWGEGAQRSAYPARQFGEWDDGIELILPQLETIPWDRLQELMEMAAGQ